MIDWKKLGGPTPAPSVTPAPTQTTTTPVAPAAPGGVPSLPGLASMGPQPYQTGQGFKPATQEQVDAMDPGQRMARGIDFLGETLFGQGNGSPFGGLPLLGDILGAAGNVAHAGADWAVVKPFEAAAHATSRVPLGWLPGGADDAFDMIGEWAKVNDPLVYEQWEAVNAAANADFLGGGNLRADFNMETAKYLDDKTYQGSLGTTPELAMGREAVGSLGGAVSHAITGWLGLGANTVQKKLGDAGVFDPVAPGQAGGRSRVEESASRLDRGEEVSDVERNAVGAWRSGAWSEDHANDWIVSHGQGVTRNLAGQILVGAVTDPLIIGSLGAAGVAAAGRTGLRVAESGLGAANTWQRLGGIVNSVQQSPMGPAFRIARGMIDPFAVYKPSTVQRAVTDVRNGVALHAFQSAYGPQTVTDMRAIAREVNMVNEVDSAMASYAIDQANLAIARKVRADQLVEGLGEDFVHTAPDDVIAPFAANASRQVETELTDHMYQVAKNTFTPEEEATLAGRLSATFGGIPSFWEGRMAGMSHDLKSAFHAITFKRTEVELSEAMAKVSNLDYTGELPLERIVLVSSDTLDDVRAEAVIGNVKALLNGVPDAGLKGSIKDATDEWNELARRYPAMADIGYATGGKEQVEHLVKELQRKLDEGGLTRRVLDEELNDPALRPVRDMLDRNYSGGKPLWSLGFRPEEDVAWGLKRDASTGRYVIDRDPTISHVMDAVPGRQPFSDTTRNVLGQVIGKSAAERVNGPIDSLEAFINTSRDMVTGRRMVDNIAHRFERATFEAGIPKSISREIFAKARDMAGLEYTTVRGIRPGNLWDQINEIIPRDLRLADGSPVTIHQIMDNLLWAAEGDLRVMGLSSVVSQRIRNALRAHGDGANWMGQMTVTMYNKLRYAQPMFLIQRITDAPYYSILYGITPVGKKALTGENAALQKVTDNLGRTGLARDFSMDMPEYAARSNFTAGIRSQMQEMALKEHQLQRILETPDTIIANNMTNMLHARLGDIVRGAIDNMKDAIKEFPPEMQAEILADAEGSLTRSFGEWRRIYSEAAGRALTDNEVGLRYVQDMLNGWRRQIVNEDGTLDLHKLIEEGERSLPADIGDIGSIKPDALAQDMGYRDAADLRKDLTVTVKRQGNELVEVKGEKDIARFEEDLRENYNAHPDYIRRAVAYFGDTWDGYWRNLARSVDEGGLDISPHYAKEAQDLIAIWARDRGMDPWEYLSGVMATNLGAKDLDTAVGQLLSFLKAGKTKQPLEEWTKMFRSTLDVSAQKELIREFESAVDVEKVLDVPTPAPFGKDAKGNATLPDGYVGVPGYVYRIESLDAARGGWPKRTGVSTEANPIYVRGGPGEGVFRSKIEPHKLATGRHGKGGKDRLTDEVTPPEQIEMLGADGRWHVLGPDPMDTIMAKDFPEMVRNRLISGQPHPNPEVEAYIRQFSKWVQESITGDLGARTRHDLRRLVLGAQGKELTGPVTTNVPPVPKVRTPPPPGESPLAPGMVRAYHYTGSKEELDEILDKGLLQSAAKGETYGEPNQIWFSTEKPMNDKHFIEVHLDPSEITGSGGAPMHLARETPRPKPAASPPPPVSRPHPYDVSAASSGQGKTGYVYQINSPGATGPIHVHRSPETFPTEEAAVAAGEDYAQRMAEKLRADLGESAAQRPKGEATEPVDTAALDAEAEAEWAAQEVTRKERLAEWADTTNKRGANFAIPDKDITPERIVTSSEPWMHEYRSLARDATTDPKEFREKFGWALADNWKDKPTGKAIAARLEDLEEAAAAGSPPVPPGTGDIPIEGASAFNRSHALIVGLLKDKIQDAQQDIFRLAEMQTKRTVLERSLNHPLFALYPSSYMWGKVLPETAKYLAKNPYAATYGIANVQRSIAIQREYDREMDEKVGAVDRSAGAFLLDYLTPSLPWSDHSSRMSPLVRELFSGVAEGQSPARLVGDIWSSELATVSPQRWVSNVTRSLSEVPGAVEEITGGGPIESSQEAPWAAALQDLQGGGTPTGGPATPQIDGPTKAAGLAPILADDLSRLSSILLQGESAEE